MRSLVIQAAQLNLTVGAVRRNRDAVRAAIESARAAGVDVVAFPELTLTGYPPEDLLLKPAFIEEQRAALDELAGSCRDIVAVVGFVDRESDLHNSAAVLADGAVQAVYHKQLLPNYTVFDEARYFQPGSVAPPVVEVNGVRLGLAICEDAWSPTGAIMQAAVAGAEVVVVINASPYEAGRQATRERLVAVRAADAHVAVSYVNLVGGQDELVFDGGSFVVDAVGAVIARAPQFREANLVVELELRGDRYRQRLVDPRGKVALGTSSEPAVRLATPGVRVARDPMPLAPAPVDGFDPGEVYAALVLATSDYVRKTGVPGALVAVSGGIDSALVATIAVDALGPDALTLVALPSRYSSEGSLRDARLLADRLGVTLEVIAIEPAHAALLEMLSPATATSGVVEENLQSRVRGTVMMALSNASGRLVLTTGNKSELAVGYSTLYGDMAGGFAVLRDLYKEQVYALARWVNDRAGIDRIPTAILAKPPSAELRPGQLDTDSLPPYEILDRVLRSLIDEDRTAAECEGVDPELARTIEAMVDRAEYKRRQGPIGPRISERAFGKDRRMPIVNRWRL
ncbi:NAD+ synthetase [Acidimicrobium ferrooxidans DSM 10331]|uniref:Glutamine-dependent NAD(+) synthetase n=1 Tax=Acidimicrobium ferrooxidans (strain DSM 10331 / JCM 15462 / NBRC 103882 / ICP) TaxID=525909 RepID=C7M2H1_ACIFD|nr:NAD+ synthase [Acidimicrobium ferrooxidans]ACU53215.1 NAD+ synthetase [Acidimicrobium ferrooxidans DSM 10331]